MTGQSVERWADEAMFKSEKHDAAVGPKVHMLATSADPLGQIAACAKMYLGEVVRDLGEITDDERRHYLAEMQKTKLKMPLEAVSLHFMLENVTRAFTHQLVRQRTAAYAQESMRFAVVEDMTEAVALPPSLVGTPSLEDWWEAEYIAGSVGIPFGQTTEHERAGYIERFATEQEQQRFKWDGAVMAISEGYNSLVNSGMPAEDARGLMPTNIITRINYITNLRGLLDHAGNRLCTQAQFEWRLVFAQIARAMRAYGETVYYRQNGLEKSSAWQWEAIAALLQPVCYQTGSCAFQANFDRKCSIRDRVQANAEINRPSSQWGEALYQDEDKPDKITKVLIGEIHPREWLADPAAAR